MSGAAETTKTATVIATTLTPTFATTTKATGRLGSKTTELAVVLWTGRAVEFTSAATKAAAVLTGSAWGKTGFLTRVLARIWAEVLTRCALFTGMHRWAHSAVSPVAWGGLGRRAWRKRVVFTESATLAGHGRAV